MQTERRMVEESFVGKWSIRDVTAAFANRDESDIVKILMDLETGKSCLEEMVEGIPAGGGGAPAMEVEILASGTMHMTIVQSLQPNAPVTVKIGMAITWKLEGAQLVTQTILDQVEAKGTIAPDTGLTSEQADALSQQIPAIEADVVKNVKSDPQMNRANSVRVLHCGKRYFLTRATEGTLMLHERM